MAVILEKSVIDTTIDFINTNDWQSFHPFKLIIHNLIPPPLPFVTKQQFLIAALNTWHHDTLSALPEFTNEMTLHERLFECGMTRFEILDPYKTFLQAIWPSPTLAPAYLTDYSYVWLQTVGQLYDHALGIDTAKQSVCQKMIFATYYLKTVSTWLRDNSIDLAETMAAWDKNIHNFYSIITRLP